MVIKIHNSICKLYKIFLVSIIIEISLISCSLFTVGKENKKEDTSKITEVNNLNITPAILPTDTFSNFPVVSPTISSTETAHPNINSVQSTQYKFVIQNGTPAAMPNFLHPESGCNWSGIGGQAFNQAGSPIVGLVVEVDGVLGGSNILGLSLTGSSMLTGPGGYEIKLADSAIASHQTLWIQLFDINGQEQTNKYYFDTYDTCEKNFILINFQESISTTVLKFYFPIIFR